DRALPAARHCPIRRRRPLATADQRQQHPHDQACSHHALHRLGHPDPNLAPVTHFSRKKPASNGPSAAHRKTSKRTPTPPFGTAPSARAGAHFSKTKSQFAPNSFSKPPGSVFEDGKSVRLRCPFIPSWLPNRDPN